MLGNSSWLSLVLVIGSVCPTLAVGGSDAAQLRTLQLTDSVASCPVGQARAIFLQLFKGSDRAIDPLFPSGTTTRLDSIEGWRFRATGIRRRLAFLAHSHAAEYSGSAAVCAFYAATFNTSLLTETGDGLAISAAPESSLYVVAICVVRDSLPSGASSTWRLREKDILLMRLTVEGEEHVLALRPVTLPREQLKREQREFRRAAMLAAGPEPKALFASKPRDSVARCLTSASPVGEFGGSSDREQGKAAREVLGRAMSNAVQTIDINIDR